VRGPSESSVPSCVPEPEELVTDTKGANRS
jgi:hypothetical protein